MTPEQRKMLNELIRCTFLPGAYDKRFVQDMHSRPDDYELTEKQATYLEKTHHRYRKQIAGAKRK